MVKSGLICLHKDACHSLWLYMVTLVCIWLVAIRYQWLHMDAYGFLCLHMVALVDYSCIVRHGYNWLHIFEYDSKILYIIVPGCKWLNTVNFVIW